MTSDEATLAKNLRKRSTDAERYLWKHLRSKQIEGLKFRRQEPIGKYIVDFVCYEKALVVEVDGGQHSEERDADRDSWLRSQGFKVLHFWNHEVLANIEAVLEVVWQSCIESDLRGHPPLTPPIKGGVKTKEQTNLCSSSGSSSYR
jgi:very-short-patch-repair endonuclease